MGTWEILLGPYLGADRLCDGLDPRNDAQSIPLSPVSRAEHQRCLRRGYGSSALARRRHRVIGQKFLRHALSRTHWSDLLSRASFRRQPVLQSLHSGLFPDREVVEGCDTLPDVTLHRIPLARLRTLRHRPWPNPTAKGLTGPYLYKHPLSVLLYTHHNNLAH
jgi:hypothetical protein